MDNGDEVVKFIHGCDDRRLLRLIVQTAEARLQTLGKAGAFGASKAKAGWQDVPDPRPRENDDG